MQFRGFENLIWSCNHLGAHKTKGPYFTGTRSCMVGKRQKRERVVWNWDWFLFVPWRVFPSTRLAPLSSTLFLCLPRHGPSKPILLSTPVPHTHTWRKMAAGLGLSLPPPPPSLKQCRSRLFSTALRKPYISSSPSSSSLKKSIRFVGHRFSIHRRLCLLPPKATTDRQGKLLRRRSGIRILSDPNCLKASQFPFGLSRIYGFHTWSNVFNLSSNLKHPRTDVVCEV